MRTTKTLIRLGGAQADLSIHWAHSHFVGFVVSRLNYVSDIIVTEDAYTGKSSAAQALPYYFCSCRTVLSGYMNFYVRHYLVSWKSTHSLFLSHEKDKHMHPDEKLIVAHVILFVHSTPRNNFKTLPQYIFLNNNYRNKLSIFAFQFDVFIYQLTFKLYKKGITLRNPTFNSTSLEQNTLARR